MLEVILSWHRPNMTEKLFTGTLRINQPTNQLSRQQEGDDQTCRMIDAFFFNKCLQHVMTMLNMLWCYLRCKEV